MDDVAAREVPVFFEVEEEIISAPTKVIHSRGLPASFLALARLRGNPVNNRRGASPFGL